MPFLRTNKIRKARIGLGVILEKIGDKGWYEFFGGQGLNKSLSVVYITLNRSLRSRDRKSVV